MTLLLQSRALLQRALINDPLHQLACLTVLLDPLWIGITDADELDPHEQDYFESPDPIQQALLVTRVCFPDLYVEAVSALHRGISTQELDALLCQGFEQVGIPLEHLELIWHGIPLPAYGSQLDEPEFYERFPQVEAILKCFGVDWEAGDIPEESADLAVMLVQRFRQSEDPIWQQMAWVLAWVWGISGNSSIDMDFETLADFEPMSWDPENVAFAREIITEANEIMSEVVAGLAALDEHPEILETLAQSVQSARKLYTRTYPKGGRITHDELCKLARSLKIRLF